MAHRRLVGRRCTQLIRQQGQQAGGGCLSAPGAGAGGAWAQAARFSPPWAPTRCPRSSSAPRSRQESCPPACRCSIGQRSREAQRGKDRECRLSRRAQLNAVLMHSTAAVCARGHMHSVQDVTWQKLAMMREGVPGVQRAAAHPRSAAARSLPGVACCARATQNVR